MKTLQKVISTGLMLMMLIVAFTGVAAADPSPTGATIASDQADYLPGATVVLTGAGWEPGESVDIFVNDDAGRSWSHNSDPDPVADENGALTYEFQLPNWFVATYTVTATGTASGSATTTFTDANQSADLDQCANDPFPSPSTDGCSASASDWVNGNLGASKSSYFEGDSIPYRLKLDNLSIGSHTVTIEWDTTKSGKHALDYITSFDRTVATANPCLGVSGCGSPTTFPIPKDPQVDNGSGSPITQAAGNFTLYGGTITSVSSYSYPNGTGFAGDKSARISITFTASVVNPVLAWGGHIATRADWGPGNSAVAISGSPYHTRLIALDGSGGNQDRSLSADAVIFPASITIIKDAVPNDAQDFGFTTTGGLTPATFTLDDDADPTNSNTQLYSGILVTSNTGNNYTVAETTVSGWTLSFNNPVCTVTSSNGGSQSGNVGTGTLSINLREGENVTCVFVNTRQAATLTLVKTVVNDNGGSATVADFQAYIDGGAVPWSVAQSVSPGSHTASESTLAGYTASSWGGDCAADGTVSLSAGQNKTCTITNNDQQAYVTVVKVVNNNHGGTAAPDDFNLTLDGSAVSSGVAVPVNPGTYTAGETLLSGYTFDGFSGDCNSSGDITVALGESKTCTLTNSDQAASITVVKVVNNNHGGTAAPDDFNLTLDGSAVSSGVAVEVTPGTYTAGETLLSGYTFDGFSGDCGSDGKVTVALGESKTCTLTNSDQQAYVTVVKVVNNNHGGTAAPDDFNLTLDGSAVSSGVAVPVNPGTYTSGETLLYGYTFDGFSGDCGSDGKVTVALGESKTCTLTNSDIAPTLTLIKYVVNDNGGTKQVSDFPLFISGNPATSGTAYTLNAGSYTASETAQSGYSASAWGGDCAADGSVTLSVGENKTCTITNDDVAPTLTLIKTVINDNGGTKQVSDFPLFISGNPATSGTAYTLNAGSYTASETTQTGYSASAWGGDCAADGSVTLGVGENKTCTITNDDVAPTLTLIKTVVNDNGGTKQVSDFPLFISGNPATSGTAYTVNAGSYIASETTQTGYSASAWGGDCAADGSVTLGVGENKTCTITNDDVAPKLHLRKIVVNNNGGTALATAWTLTADGAGSNDLSGSTPVDSGAGLQADTFALSESGPTGYAASNWVCTGGTQNGSNITVGIGEEATCTITNDDIQPKLTLVKTVVNDNGGTLGVADFPLFVGATSVTSGVANGFNAGTYTASETSQYGYTASAWGGDCAANGSVTLNVGDDKTCTITNDDQPGTIIVKKIIKPEGSPTSFSFDASGTGYADFSLSANQMNTQVLDAGSYSVKEMVPLGWVLTGIGGSSNPNTPYNCTITGSGGSTGVGDLNTQTATIDLKNGDTVTCVFENTGQGVTRTQGFWATHPQLAQIAWFGGTAFGHTFPGVGGVSGIGDTTLCGRPIDTLGKLMGAFWSDISKKSTGAKRSSLDQARMQLLQQLIAAELNASAFGSVPSSGSFSAWESAYCGTNQNAIKNAQQQAASFNSAGDSSTFTPGTSADSKTARSISNAVFWDTLP